MHSFTHSSSSSFLVLCDLREDGVSLQQHRNNLCRRLRNLKRKKQKLATQNNSNTNDDGDNTDVNEGQDEQESDDSDFEGEEAASSLLGLNKKRPAKK